MEEMKLPNYYSTHITLILLSGLLLISACSGNSKNEAESTNSTTIHVDVKETKTFDISEVADVVRYVPLETHEDALIGKISKLYFKNDSIIVFDRENKNIFLFDQNGSFVRKIGVKGNGPSEYIEFNDVHYDAITDKLYAFERFQNKMFVYSLNGNLDEAIDSNFSFNSFIKSENGYWIYSCFSKNNPDKYHLIYTDERLSMLKSGYLPQKEFVNIADEKCFSEDVENNKYFYYPNSNIIYKLGDNKMDPFLEMDFGGRTLPYDEMKNASDNLEVDKIRQSNNYVGGINNVHFLKQTCIFNCSQNIIDNRFQQLQISVDLESKKANVYDRMQNAEGSPNLLNLLYTTDKDELVYAIDPNSLPEFLIKELKKILPSVSSESNPVLSFYKVK